MFAGICAYIAYSRIARINSVFLSGFILEGVVIQSHAESDCREIRFKQDQDLVNENIQLSNRTSNVTSGIRFGLRYHFLIRKNQRCRKLQMLRWIITIEM